MSELNQNNYKPPDDVPLSVCGTNYSTAYSRLLIGYKSEVSVQHFKIFINIYLIM